MDNSKPNPITEIQNKLFHERLISLKEGFQAMETTDVRTLPEIMFTTYFLPLFSGETTENSNELISQWFIIAGTNYSAVNIVDAKGNFVIKIPPLHDRNVFSPILKRSEDIAYAFNVAREKASLSPNLAKNIIQEELNNRYDHMVSQEFIDLKNEWTNVFKHYGKTQVNNVKSKNEHSDIDEFDY